MSVPPACHFRARKAYPKTPNALVFPSPPAPPKVSTGGPRTTSLKPVCSIIHFQPAHGRPPAIQAVQRSISRTAASGTGLLSRSAFLHFSRQQACPRLENGGESRGIVCPWVGCPSRGSPVRGDSVASARPAFKPLAARPSLSNLTHPGLDLNLQFLGDVDDLEVHLGPDLASEA